MASKESVNEEAARGTATRLRGLAELFQQRNAVYGNDHAIYGRVLAAVFPDGLAARSEIEFHRLFHVVLMAMKLTRYAANFTRDGHADSLDDLAVYAQMLAELDDRERATLRATLPHTLDQMAEVRGLRRHQTGTISESDDSLRARITRHDADLEQTKTVEATKVLDTARVRCVPRYTDSHVNDEPGG